MAAHFVSFWKAFFASANGKAHMAPVLRPFFPSTIRWTVEKDGEVESTFQVMFFLI